MCMYWAQWTYWGMTGSAWADWQCRQTNIPDNVAEEKDRQPATDSAGGGNSIDF